MGVGVGCSTTSRSRVSQDRRLHIRQGFGGTVYAYSSDRQLVVDTARSIGKSPGQVYHNLGVWAMRCRSNVHRAKLLELGRQGLGVEELPKNSFGILL